MERLKLLDLFSGIGGFSLGLERSGGFETVAFCEIDPFCQRVLAKHWPEVPCYDDVRDLSAERLSADGISVDVICGGFPCQDLSRAGRQAGLAGERSGLWGHFHRLIRELQPRYVIVENVPDLLVGPSEQPGAWFGQLLGDLASLGYDAEWHRLPAAVVGASQLRDRIWIVAHANRDDDRRESDHRAIRGGAEAGAGEARNANGQRDRRGSGDGGKAPLARYIAAEPRDEWPPEPAVGRLVDGIPPDMARWRKRAVESLGNAVVPQIPELIGRAIIRALSSQEEAA